tara:strand:- start:117 stop:617 length:501 start_codon:yes stop_codon:yes gene_type:complete
MNTKSFVKILRKVIREEVRSAVKEILNEEKTPHKKVIDHGLALHGMVEQQENPYEIKARTKKRSYSKNSMLNDILNETAISSDFSNMQEGPLVGQEYPNMSEMMTADKAPTFASMMNQKTPVDTIPTTDVHGNVVNKNSLPDHVTSALTKDYSAVMKAIDKKKGIK